MEKYALISVSNRAGLSDFAKGLQAHGYTLLTTSGSGAFLQQDGISSVAIDEYTGQREILGGRVKTLHPKIHAGILARRSVASDLEELRAQEIPQIDIVAVNLYPFEAKLRENPDADRAEMIEFIDIGGPTMIRAAAKNSADVFAVIDPEDYAKVLEVLDESHDDLNRAQQVRSELSTKVFAQLAHYNLEIAKFLSRNEHEEESLSCSSIQELSAVSGAVWPSRTPLRYGENPQQPAALYSGGGERSWKQLAGKPLSYNNILDADAGYRLIRTLTTSRDRFGGKEVVCIMKHLTPCGVATGGTGAEALRKAKQCDPRSHFGGIIGFSSPLTSECAQEVIQDFVEIIIAPGFSDGAREVLSQRKNIRLLECDYEAEVGYEVRSTLFGSLKQAPDASIISCRECEEVVESESRSDSEGEDLELAWILAAHTKSNAIVLVKNQMLIGSGAGQTSRIDAVEVAIYKAKEHKHDISGAVAASDAFFPFPDSVERLAEEGVAAIVVPNGSKQDEMTIQTAREKGVGLLFAPERHFRH
ncbi:bifunctional phosphoribosylaminoimidazolecarboxamide formyltransferase/IMP cyclohydrolase [bacterium]|nr:bifunctional phosphoribosylaminoimidazolecarboxamide formyltransferase/IMP cyclohydrolase [bacterium]